MGAVEEAEAHTPTGGEGLAALCDDEPEEVPIRGGR